MFFGMIIENAAQETREIGDPPKLVNRYNMRELLSPGFIIANQAEEQFLSDFQALRGMAGIKFDEVR